MKTITAVLMQIALAAALFAAATAHARTPLERRLKTLGYHLPNVISYDDLYEKAYDEGIVDIEKMLAEHDVQVQGEGDSRYVRASDLLDVCGGDCSYDKGWGFFLSGFAVLTHRK